MSIAMIERSPILGKPVVGYVVKHVRANREHTLVREQVVNTYNEAVALMAVWSADKTYRHGHILSYRPVYK